MRIAIIGSRGLYSTHGGIEKCLAQLCPRLAALGCEIDVYGALAEDGERLIPGVRSIRVPAWSGKYTETLSRTLLATLLVLLRSGRYDVVNFVAVGPGLFSFLPRLFGMPVVVSIHGLDWQRAKWPAWAKWMLKLAETCLVMMATEITVVSRQLQTYFERHYGRRVVFAPNGLTLLPSSGQPGRVAKLGLVEGRYILFASRLVREKGAHELIEAFNRVETDLQLAIVGGGLYDQEYVQALHAADRTGRCVFTGHLTGDDLAAAFQGAYLYVLPSHIEGMSLSLLEALAFGKPVLVSDIPENIEVVGDSAFTFPVGNVQALAAKLSELAQAPDEVQASARRFQEGAGRNFDWDTVAEKYFEVFERAQRAPASRGHEPRQTSSNPRAS